MAEHTSAPSRPRVEIWDIDGCKVAAVGRPKREVADLRAGVDYAGTSLKGRLDGSLRSSAAVGVTDDGRWPPNVLLSHAALLNPVTGEAIGDACADGCVDGCPVAELDRQSGIRRSGGHPGGLTQRPGLRGNVILSELPSRDADVGGASRFFPIFRFEAKASTAERPRVNGEAHPTVKPLALMRWLVRLVTPPGGTVLDCFAGTGTTGQAARAEGFSAILIESDIGAIPMIRARLDALPSSDAPPAGEPPTDTAPVDLFS